MKLLLVLSLVLGVTLGLPQAPNTVGIVRSEAEGPNADGSYRYDFETEDGIARNEAGALKDPETMGVNGGFSYTAPDGTVVVVTYESDELGFRPKVEIRRA
ncbi:UNVERIFIED_CONTAM: hypothetical protein RMT77_013105 [Armadillidium vulgare]